MPVKVRRADARDLTALGELFTVYPYKTMQQAAQKLDRQRLDAFFQAGLGRQIEDPAEQVWLAEMDDGPVAVAGVGESAWHSSIFEMKMGRVQPWLNTLRPAETGEPLLEAVENAARTMNLEHLSTRVDGSDFRNLHLFEGAGWRLVDVSVKFSMPMPLGRRHALHHQIPRKLKIGTAKIDDAEWILKLGSQTHSGTHYFNDPALAPELTRKLFAKWLERCIERLAYKIYTVKDEDGTGLGFVTYLAARGFAEATGSRPLVLDFVVIDPGSRGKGLAPWFIEETLLQASKEGFDYCELRTSMHNLPAIGCYQKLGFQCCATDFGLHKKL